MIGAARGFAGGGRQTAGSNGSSAGRAVRFFGNQRRGDERLIWSRDTRYLHRLRERVPGGRLLELATGACLIAPAESLTETLAAEVAGPSGPEFGLVAVDTSLPESEKYLHG
jgi:hypothetical protein